MTEQAANLVDPLLSKLKPLSPEAQARREFEAKRDAEERGLREYAQLLIAANVPKRHLGRTEFHNSAWQAKLCKLSELLGSGFFAALIGIRGNGKTQLAVELIRANARLNKRSLYCTAARFLMDVKATYKQDSEESERDIIATYAKPALLVVDELAVRAETKWEECLLAELVDRRYGNLKDTLILSNQDRPGFETSLGPSLISRLNETGGLVECDWESFR